MKFVSAGEARARTSTTGHFREQLPTLYEMPEPSRAVIKLLDRETAYKHIVGHHDGREERHL
ncbi:MAG TPA: hypothetical protein VF521_02355 [Pyrinomonadaceae bacterium]